MTQAANTRQRIEGLHRLYVQLTGFAVPLDMHRESVWFEWQRKGLTEEDLKLVVAFIQRGIRDQRRQPGALRFGNLIGQIDRFEEDLAEARAARRAWKEAERAERGQRGSVLRATGRPAASVENGARSVGDIIAGGKAFEEFRRLKERL